jgi:predicted branched-subunit amino acid permease
MSAKPRAAIIRDGVSIGIAVGAYAISFGALGTTSGLSVLQTQLLSLLLFSGASQFAVVSIVGAGGAAASAWASSALLGMRNGLYGLRLAPLLGAHGWRKPIAAHLTIDESTAMALANDDDADPSHAGARTGFWATGLSVFVFWNSATFIGAVAGSHISDPRVFGLDAAIPAGFAALVAPRLTTSVTRGLALVCAVVATSASPWVRPGVPVLLAALIALAAAMRFGEPVPTPARSES